METQLREALLTSALSRYRIAQLTGVSNASLSLFVNGRRSLSLGAASLLAEVLGFQLVREKRTRKAR
jgi:plasmid maintenance system antidote protein VapI